MMAGLLALLAGCGSGEIPVPNESFARLIAPCQAQEGSVREHCVVAALGTMDLAGSDILVVCEGLRDAGAHDLCVERAVWTRKAPSPVSECKRIDHERTRQSCVLGGTNPLMDGPIEPLLEACSAAEDLEVECMVHVLTGRRFDLQEKGLVAVHEEVQTILKLRPSFASQPPVATEVGRIVSPLTQSSDAFVCSLFEPSAEQACRGALRPPGSGGAGP
jgi:hypothetical protein